MTAWLINLTNVFFPSFPLICFVVKMRGNLSSTRKSLDFVFSHTEAGDTTSPIHPYTVLTTS